MTAEAPTKTVVVPPPAGNPRPPQAPVDVGAVLGRYRLLHPLGHGGMATVFLGRKVGAAGFEKLAAIKVIHPHLAAEPDFVEMFLDEARIAARLHHPNVVQILDLGEADGRSYMVMEYVEGDSVASLAKALADRGERLPLPAVLQIVDDAAAGLSAAHALQDADGNPLHLVHRDVSPHNLLVSKDGWVKVVDFGIAKAVGRRSTTLTGQLRGKVPYMAPEQARGEPLDARTDVFALGVVFWELLAGRRLFEGKTEAAVLERVLACEVPRLSDVPDAVVRVVERALAADREDRYPDADALRRDVRAALLEATAGEDPRRLLATELDRVLGDKLAYARAQISASSGRYPEPPTNPDVFVPPPAATGTGPRPRPRWPYVVFPLAGAAAAVAYLLAVRSAAPGDGQATPTAQPAAPVEPATPKPPARVPITINTDPQGAAVVVAGAPHPAPTPTTLSLPRSDQPVTLELSLPGHVPRTVQVVPATAGSYDFVLRPNTPAATPIRLQQRTEGSPTRARRRARTDPATTRPRPPGEVPAPANEGKAPATSRPTLAPMPDFERIARDPSSRHQPGPNDR